MPWHATGAALAGGPLRDGIRPPTGARAALCCRQRAPAPRSAAQAARDAANKRSSQGRPRPSVQADCCGRGHSGADKFAPPGERDADRTRGGTPARLPCPKPQRIIRARPGCARGMGRRPSRRMQAPTTGASPAPLQSLLSVICSSTHAGGLERDARAAVRGRAAAAAARSDSSPDLAYLNPRKPPPLPLLLPPRPPLLPPPTPIPVLGLVSHARTRAEFGALRRQQPLPQHVVPRRQQRTHR